LNTVHRPVGSDTSCWAWRDPMGAKYILLGLGCVFLIAAVSRLATDQWQMSPAPRAWLLIGGIFLAVGLWLLHTG
jgi:hypothetical protein